jgi:phosphoribosyl-AMP cyclohydrolase
MNIDFGKNSGLIPVIVQEAVTKEVLMLGYANQEALEKTIKTGFAHFYSRSRNKMWMKGESSGHTQKIVEIRVDCDQDTILYLVIQNKGIACHGGYSSCFFRTIKNGELVINSSRIKNPEEIYSIGEKS